jgi:hypothetical protein
MSLIRSYGAEMAVNPEVQYWLRQGWDASALLLTVAVTLAAMFLGSRSRPQTQEEQTRVEAYFRDLATPVLVSSAQRATIATGPDLKVMGVTMVLFGGLMGLTALLILASSGETFSLMVNLLTGGGFLLFGSLVYLKGRKIPLQQNSQDT